MCCSSSRSRVLSALTSMLPVKPPRPISRAIQAMREAQGTWLRQWKVLSRQFSLWAENRRGDDCEQYVFGLNKCVSKPLGIYIYTRVFHGTCVLPPYPQTDTSVAETPYKTQTCAHIQTHKRAHARKHTCAHTRKTVRGSLFVNLLTPAALKDMSCPISCNMTVNGKVREQQQKSDKVRFAFFKLKSKQKKYIWRTLVCHAFGLY